ncbi:MAG: 50S ribosomal protein L18 [Bacteriovoracaceae bacterium]|nr:50S ribosomal protein L18 [Bacteriovoracaceae bacterium]
MRKQFGKINDKALANRTRRKLTIRKKVTGTAERPRICVTKSNKHLRIQAINDDISKTIFSVQTFGKDAPKDASKSLSGAKVLGVKVSDLLKENKIQTVVFDRSGYKYTGLISALADSIREEGIQL